MQIEDITMISKTFKMFDASLELRIKITPSKILSGRFFGSEITFEMLSFIEDYINGKPFVAFKVDSRFAQKVSDNKFFKCYLWSYDDSRGFNLQFENFSIGQIADEEGEKIFEFLKYMDGIEINFEPTKPGWPLKNSPEYLSLTIPFHTL